MQVFDADDFTEVELRFILVTLLYGILYRLFSAKASKIPNGTAPYNLVNLAECTNIFSSFILPNGIYSVWTRVGRHFNALSSINLSPLI